MSRNTRFKLFFNNELASVEQLERVDTITVEQEVDVAWEARLEIPICLDRSGQWKGADETFMRPRARVRVEVSVADDQFVPLIDGPVVGLDTRMQFEPGQSVVTLTVQDDSVFLNDRDDMFFFDEDDTVREIVRLLFGSYDQLSGTPVIDDDLDSPAADSYAMRANGTAMQVLRCLARVHEKHVNVLPGENRGESLGSFRALPRVGDRNSDSLPPLVLLSSEANVSGLDVRRDFTGPEETFSSNLSISDKGLVSRTASYLDRELLGDSPVVPDDQEPARRRLRPAPCVGPDPDQAVSARSGESSFSLEASGRVIEGCYRGVLRPYQLVEVQAGETPLGGDWVVKQVTHTLSRSSYGQSFTLSRNAESETQSERATQADLIGSIF